MSARGIVRDALARTPSLQRVAATAAHPTRKGERLTAAARAVRYEWAKRQGRPTLVPLGEHSRLLAYPGETNSPAAVIANPPNVPEMYVWRRHLRPGDIFVDVGANIGVYTIWALELGAEVIAVEPNARNAARIREHLDLNGYTARVEEKALTDAPGVVRMTTDLDSLNHITDSPAGVEVEATTLDELLGDRTASVKVDVEGAEHLVLSGAKRALAEQRITLMQLEWQVGEWMGTADRGAVADLLAGAGYALYASDGRGALHALDGQPPTGLNVFALPAGDQRSR